MRILGLGHYSRTGKDSLANFIKKYNKEMFPEPLRIKKISLAWKLKQIAHDLYGWAGLREPEFYDTPEGERFRDIRLPGLKMTPVEVWVAIGTPAIRDNVYDRTWIDYILKTDHNCDLLIVPDVRFPNEVEAFKNEGARLVKVVREGYGPRDTVADQALVGWNGWDYIAGHSTMDHLKQDASHLIHWAHAENDVMYQPPEERSLRLSLEGGA